VPGFCTRSRSLVKLLLGIREFARSWQQAPALYIDFENPRVVSPPPATIVHFTYERNSPLLIYEAFPLPKNGGTGDQER